MADRPILFNGAMVRAILSGAKMQTRRPIKPTSRSANGIGVYTEGGRISEIVNTLDGEPIDAASIACPFGVPGDRLWVRECHAFDPCEDSEGNAADRVLYRATYAPGIAIREQPGSPWRPSIHMPRWASRLLLRVTDVRIERVQDISEEDAKAEGITGPHNVGYPAFKLPDDSKARYSCATAAFEDLWSSTYGPESWSANPWCWCVSFEVIP